MGLQRHSSLRYKNRTLPPLPAPRQRSETFKGCPKFLTKSQPHLEDTDEDKTLEINENSPPVPGRIKRRLSNSMECLKSSSSIADPIEASPYISPVNVQAVLAANKKPSGLVTSSVRVPPQTRGYPSLPDGFLTLGRNGSQYERDQAKSTPRLFDGPGELLMPTYMYTCIYAFVHMGEIMLSSMHVVGTCMSPVKDLFYKVCNVHVLVLLE